MTYDEALINECIHKLKISLLKADILQYSKKLLKLDERLLEEDLDERAREQIRFAKARGYTYDDVARHCQLSKKTIIMAHDYELKEQSVLLAIIIQLNQNFLNKYTYDE